MTDFEQVVNGMFAIQEAEKVKKYCESFKKCDEGCVFFCGICSLNRFPWDWDFKKVEWNE